MEGSAAFRWIVLASMVGVCLASSSHHFRHQRHRRNYSYFLTKNITLGMHSKVEEEGPWGDWSDSSDCSRSCGGGVAFQTRTCRDIKTDGTHSCKGPSKRYFSCNIQDCPENSRDFREEQCSKFDPVPFDGKLFNWVPYSKGLNPCELNCMPKGERFYYRHAKKVKDGTRCYEGSMDVCVDGVCMAVGCDMMLGSEVSEDKCRECGGDGSSCKTVEGLFDLDNLQVGYNDILLIPAGATNIKVMERYPTNNYLAVRNLTGHFYLNGNWRIEFPRDLKFAGTTFHYERKSHGFLAPETIRALGATTEPIFIVLLYQEKNQGISYEYSIPNGVSNAQPDTYSWIFGNFGECSNTCGGGHQVRPVNCAKTSSFEVVAEYLCDPNLKPSTNRSCNGHPCPARWQVGHWDECSNSCNGGTQYRYIHCQQVTEGGISVLATESKCEEDDGSKPLYIRTCNENITCPSWHAGPWTSCDKMCGEGSQKREVTCRRQHDKVSDILDDLFCDPNAKLSSFQSCFVKPCEGVEWMVSDWSGCDGTCNLQMESREIHCASEQGILFPLEMCDSQRAPQLTRSCSDSSPCKTMWHSSEWSECSSKCGTGVQTRIVICGIWDGHNIKQVLDDKCKIERKPHNMQNCSRGPCKGMWFTGPWNRCTVPCGGGHRIRKILCFHKDNVVSNSRCDLSLRPFDKEPCNLHRCDEDEIIIVGGCHKSKHGCCPDGVTSAGPNFEGCPHIDEMPEDRCDRTEYGCCLDGITPALGPFKKGCPSMTFCNETKYGCCPDGVTPAKGFSSNGCPEDCSNSKWGCCPDGITPSRGKNNDGCDSALEKSCFTTTYGCCPDGVTAAVGLDQLGCDFDESSGESCENSLYGCCPDGITPASNRLHKGCPNIGVYVLTTSSPEQTSCVDTKFGCCSDGLTEAKTSDHSDCEDEDGSGEFYNSCINTLYGCCPDGLTSAKGPNNFGCKIEQIAPISPTKEPHNRDCSAYVYGCCSDEKTFALGPNKEGCCRITQFGCCPDNITFAEGPYNEGCSCHTFTYGCCPDGETPAKGPRYHGCGCAYQTYGCCQDKFTSATGPNFEGCYCDMMLYGCCPDGKTPAEGPNNESCGCQASEHGCCPDGQTFSKGTNFQGCPCNTMPHGCCLDGRTIASGPDYRGCPCYTMPHGCCPDGKTLALGSGFVGCPCNTMTYGCCPDNLTPATGPSYGGCPCNTLPHGCCPDGTTPSTGPNLDGCPCNTLHYGCCPDGKTPAKGPHSKGCLCASTFHGCCPDGISVAQGPNFEGCQEKMHQETKSAGVVCSLPKERGSCRNYTVKWFFDMTYGGCSRFWYGGCEGNKNRFNTQEECDKACVTPEGADACLLPKVVGPCEGIYPSWYFDSSSGICSSFEYSGCLGNNNRFVSQEICEQTCVHQEALSECEQPLAVGPCKGNFPKWYYNKYTGHCKPFIFGGCKGNDNNFESEKECVERCASLSEREICILPKVEGPCLGNFPRWYYDYMDGKCKEFVYSGCQGNRNRFVTRDQCERICNATHVAVSSDICSLPKEEGPCQAAILHWYYNKKSGRCEKFYYGGCEGNANRFETRNDCDRACTSPGELDICHAPQEIGNCYEFRERWYHNASEGRCRRFYYSGCGGNENNFASHSECEKRCGKQTSTEMPEDEFRIEFCSQEHDVGPCSNTDIRWFYDKNDGVCKEFYYGGCRGNGNRFRTRRECETKCANSQDICTLPKVQGPCSGSFAQWYYDHNNDQCHEFSFSGCQGNANRFNDKETCESQCKKHISVLTTLSTNDMCLQPLEPGPCLGYFPMWHYDKTENLCKSFIYGGCEGNKNRFESQKKCEHICLNKTSPSKPKKVHDEHSKDADALFLNNADVCRLPAASGTCNEAHTRWYYDVKNQDCYMFVYSGCAGNKNRFKSYDMCVRFCTGIKATHKDVAAEEAYSDIPPLVSTHVCPPSNCATLQCPYGLEEMRDDTNCLTCICFDPCKSHSCPNDTQCIVEVYRSSSGEPRPQSICRLVSKPGKCPLATEEKHSTSLDCSDKCHTDADCGGDYKCCSNGCAHICARPKSESSYQLPKPDTRHSGSYQPPHIVAAEQEIIAETGSKVILRCTARGSPIPSISWSKNNKSLTSNEGQYTILIDGSLHIPNVTLGDMGTFICSAENGVGLPVSRFIRLIVYERVSVSVILVTPEYQAGTPLQLDCVVQGIPIPSVEWHLNNKSIHLQHEKNWQLLENHTIYIPSASSLHNGLYKCTGSNEFSNSSASVTISVENVYVPENCTDSPYFANCALIVKAQYCINPHYAKFCCRSCLLSGQIQRISPSAS